MDASPAVAEKKDEKKGPDKWEIDNWVRTVMEADEIKHDPEKWKAVRPHLEKKARAAVKTMADLRARAKESEDDDADT